MKQTVSWSEIDLWVSILVMKIQLSADTFESIYGFPRGGLIPAVMLSHRLNIPLTQIIQVSSLLVDDIADSGKTLSGYLQKKATLVWREGSVVKPDFIGIEVCHKRWFVYPWELRG